MRFIKLSCAEAVYRAAEGDTLAEIAERLGTTAENIAAANGPREPADGELLFVPNLDCRLYTVQPLDTAQGIAERFGVPRENVLTFGTERLYVGQKVPIRQNK